MTAEKLIKTMSPYDCISQLLVSLLGEPSFFLKINADGSKFVVIPESLLSLPPYIAMKIEKIAQMSTCVRSIENWRRDLVGVDSIKRSFIESICESYNVFLNLVDNMRMNQISGNVETTFEEMLAFVMQWHERINYVNRLITASLNRCGMELMNIVFMEWSMQCIADWNYSLLEQTLDRMSLAFHKLACNWLLDGKLPQRMNWMICEDDNKHDESNLSRQNANVETKSKLNAVPNVYEKVRIDHAYSPFSLSGCHGLIRKIYDIGRNVYFLREFRRQKIYEYRLEERIKLLEDEQINKSKLWYSIAERGHLYSIVQQYGDIICEDIMNEVMVKQRLQDHILFVQTHFLLLNGDFVSAIYDAIRESPVKDRLAKGSSGGTRAVSPYGGHINLNIKNSSRSDFMAQACVNYALNFVSQQKNFLGLKPNLVAEKPQQPSSSAIYLEDLVRLGYKSPAVVSAVLSDYMIQIYARIFATIAPFRMLFGRIDDVALRMRDLHRRHRRYNSSFFRSNHTDCSFALSYNKGPYSDVNRFNNNVISTVRRFTSAILNYFYEEVLAGECAKVMETLNRQTDLPSLISSHSEFLSIITIALFLHKSTKSVHDALRHCLRTARHTLKCINDFINCLEESKLFNADSSEKLTNECSNSNELDSTQLLEYKAFLKQNYAEFLEALEQVKIAFDQVMVPREDIRQSMHWQNFNLPQFLPLSTQDIQTEPHCTN